MSTINLVFDRRGGLLAALSSNDAANRFLKLDEAAANIRTIDLDADLPALHMDISRFDVTIFTNGRLGDVTEDVYSYDDLTNPPLVICGWQRDPNPKWHGGQVHYWKVELCATSGTEATRQARAIIKNLVWEQGTVYHPGPNNIPGDCTAMACPCLEQCVAWSADTGHCLICEDEQRRQAALTTLLIHRPTLPNPAVDNIAAW